MRTIVRNSFAHETIESERVHTPLSCTWCGQHRVTAGRGARGRTYLLRFHVSGDSARTSGPIIGGKLFCSRECGESYLGRSFDETKG